MKVIVIIQARMGSTRLPGKIMLPLGSTVVLDYVVSRSKQIGGVTDVIIATSTSDKDTPIWEWCKKNQVSCFRGSEEDVLSRFYDCATAYQPDYFIRVTSDCPFLDYQMMNQIMKQVEEQPVDFVFVNGALPRGLEAEIASFSALETMNRVAREAKYREHVTYYAYEHKHQFQTTSFQAPISLCHPEIRITLDTEDDYLLCHAVAQHFNGDLLVPSQSIVDYLLEHPELAQINSHVKQKDI
ncbi:acylneuraminate cytidylyltransferase [Brevibacillus choshinensis]|uniref:Acylneuraminate cytidylyltransferase n=1 Tax=Brevibacillus choshinensis TaxID=54911 RepID=A0ABR5NEX5_BRECH|nr:glycosyltransferase family protein [Brevibacillus choshinensis]KQL50090.1 acylneuraminate cytidylyltransferase [Brevibacillus choshinensis]